MPRKKNPFDLAEPETPTVVVSDDFMEALSADRPLRTDAGWSEYLLGRLVKGEYIEKDRRKFPFVHGLRRLVLAELGDIVESRPTHVQFPSSENGFIAGVVYMVRIVNEAADLDVTYADAADATPDNNCDEPFDLFPTAMATTRAEARALRKALGLKATAAEELSEGSAGRPRTMVAPPPETPDAPRSIKPNQLASIPKYCRDMKVDLDKFLAKYSRAGAKDVSELSSESAAGMLSMLNKWFQKRELIPDEVKIDEVLAIDSGVSQAVGTSSSTAG